MSNKREGDLAGKHPDMGIKTAEGQDNEGHLAGSNQAGFNEQSAQQHEQEDDNELNRKDARGDVRGTASV